MRTLPEGSTVLARLTAAIASSGEMRYARSRSGFEPDDDGPLVAAEGRRRGDARQRGEQRAHAVERDVLHLAGLRRRAREHQLPDRHAAGVEAHDERRHGAGRHESAGAVDVADHLRHGLAHVGAGMEHQLHQRRALDALRLDVLDAGDVEEVILVVVRQEKPSICEGSMPPYGCAT